MSQSNELEKTNKFITNEKWFINSGFELKYLGKKVKLKNKEAYKSFQAAIYLDYPRGQ